LLLSRKIKESQVKKSVGCEPPYLDYKRSGLPSLAESIPFRRFKGKKERAGEEGYFLLILHVPWLPGRGVYYMFCPREKSLAPIVSHSRGQ